MSSMKPALSANPARVRFAPSPTGLAHIGVMRSALFNWLWARHTGGTFVLRLEDTDRTRFVKGAAEQIYDSHDALGITPDEGPIQGGDYGPYIQSERLDIYHDHANQLLESGALYRCWCSPERLTSLREQAQAKGQAFKYDRHCLTHPGDPNDPHVLRFRIPSEPKIVDWDDAVRGHLEVATATLDDFVAIKADGFPTYHFANIVDDRLMQITHVLRADEWLPSTPKHLLLWQAFGWEPPLYAHLPAVQGPTGGKKLSKRDGAEPVQAYIAQGYLPEALRSFLATLGWNDGTTQEVYTTDELIQGFTLERIQKSPARFDRDRLTWVNGMMIRALWQSNPAELMKHAQPFWPAAATSTSHHYRQAVLGLVYDRLKFLAELPDLTDFFFTDPDPRQTIASLPVKSADPSALATWLHASIQALASLPENDFTAAHLESLFRATIAPQLQLSNVGPLFMALRIILTGRTATPGLFETMAVLGHTTVLRRLTASQTHLKP